MALEGILGVIVDQGADSMISMERLRIDQALSGHVVNNPHINIQEVNIYLVSIVITYLLFATHGIYTWPFEPFRNSSTSPLALPPPPIMLHTPVPTVPSIKYGHERGGASSTHIPDPLVRCIEGKTSRG